MFVQREANKKDIAWHVWVQIGACVSKRGAHGQISSRHVHATSAMRPNEVRLKAKSANALVCVHLV